ncbi:MAG: CHAD domain-containing protein [Opitutae bacterium]|nr:CHAD domain-containing protein [Opitutae bacterium]
MKPSSSPPRPLRPRRRSRQAAHLAGTLQALWHAYRQEHRRCQRHCGRRSVHDLRVATRRLLAHLDLLGVLLDEAAVTKARRLLKRRLAAFAALRDGQVQLELVGAQLRTFPELRPLQVALEKSERKSIAIAAQALGHDRNDKLRKQLAVVTSRLAAACALAGADRRHGAAIARAMADRLKQAAQRQSAAGQDPDAIHRTRVAMKKYRYLLEALRPLLRRVEGRRYERLVDFQNVTGDLHDIAVLLARIESMVAKEKLEAWRTHRFRETLVRRRATLLNSYGQLARELFAQRAAALQFELQRA